MKFRPRLLRTTQDNSCGGHEPLISRLKGIFSACIILAGVYFLLGLAADFMVGWVPPQTEAQWFSWSDQVLQPQLPVPEDLQATFHRLLADASLRDFSYHLVFLADDDINAFAFPGGAIVVTSGLYETVHGEIGRALVLGHEIGHIEKRHGLQQLGRSLLLAGAYSLLGLDTSIVLKRSQDLAALRFSRHQESDADAFGLRLVYRVFGSTEGALEFFEQIQTLQDGEEHPLQDRMRSFLQTHPLTQDRLQSLQELSAQLEQAN